MQWVLNKYLFLLFVSSCLCVRKIPTIDYDSMVTLKGGLFQMGINDNEGINGEAPAYRSGVKPFKIDIFPVINREFKKFILAKPNFLTDAESRGWSHVFQSYVTKMNLNFIDHSEAENEHESWMIRLKNATWKNPLGLDSNIVGKENHPVIHVSKRDAAAFCYWKGKRLATEHEWEFAARGGLKGLEYPWGDSYEMGRTNLWQGKFPENDTARDGFAGTSPVKAFKPQNEYGLYDMIGNVWEWTNTRWHLRYHTFVQKEHNFVLKGGSHIDSRRGHVGQKARISTRIYHLFHYSASNVGFRCAQTIEQKPTTPKVRPIILFHSEL